MRRFFELAFQQTQITAVDFADQAYPKQIGINNTTIPLLMQNAQQSFARTMLQLTGEGRPLTDGVTTQKLMMTTALKEMYAFLDVWDVDDNGKVTDHFRQANPGLTITVGTAQGAIPIAETLDPASPNYMHWYNPDVATNDPQVAGCTIDPIIYPPSAITLHYLLYGSLDGHRSGTGVQCPNSGGSAAAPQFLTSDFSDWTMVTIRQPAAGEAVSKFYDLPALRGATELVLSIPRTGFFSTPAFFANWQTNISNQMRVTLNQTLIVALGSSVDGTDQTATTGQPSRAGCGARRARGLLFLPPHARSAAVDFFGQLFVELSQPDRPAADPAEGTVHLPGREPSRSPRIAELGRSWPSILCSPRPGRKSFAPTSTRRPAWRMTPSSSAWWRRSATPTIPGTCSSASCCRRP